MEFFCNFIWEQGLREKNEDSLCIRQVTQNGRSYLLAVVCDGIGGLSEGENASSFVTNSMLEELKHLIKKKGQMSGGRIRNSFFRRLYRCHKTLQTYGKDRQIRLGTTISMVLIVGLKGYLFHVGDSSVFMGKKRLKRKTPIQHVVGGALLQAVGIGKNPLPTFRQFVIKRGMVILLVSDGFYRKCEEEICSRMWIKYIVCDEKKIGSVLGEMKNKVQKLGERDNISAICIKIQ